MLCLGERFARELRRGCGSSGSGCGVSDSGRAADPDGCGCCQRRAGLNAAPPAEVDLKGRWSPSYGAVPFGRPVCSRMENPIGEGNDPGGSSGMAQDLESKFRDAQFAMDEALERQSERSKRYEAFLAQQALRAQRIKGKEERAVAEVLSKLAKIEAAKKANLVEPDAEQRDEKLVVDWTSEPDAEIARISRLFNRPTCVIQREEPPIAFWYDVEDGPETGLKVLAGGEIAHVEPGSEAFNRGVTTNYTLVRVGNTPVTAADSEADIRDMLSERPIEVRFRGGRTEKRLVFDKADAALDERGWPTGKTIHDQTPQEYPYAELNIDEMGSIGGIGLRLYFYLLSFLGTCFFVMAVLTTPSIIITYSEFNMYEHHEATHYKSLLAMTTLGNINTAVDVLESADEPFGSHSLWTLSAIEAAGSLFMLCMVLRAGARMRELVERVDHDSVTMADYTVMVEPVGKWKAYSAFHKEKGERFIEDVESALEKAVPNSQIARVNNQKCIWIAWDEDEIIGLWNAKKAQLFSLEAALRDAHLGGENADISLEKVAAHIEAINLKIRALDAEMEWMPVYAFATFNLGEHSAKALRVGQVEIGGIPCKILPAPEPESLLWQHLEYSKTERMKRRYTIMSVTALSLIIGAALIIYANALKVGTKYLSFCSDVMGPDAKAEYSGICPLPATPEQMDGAAKLYHHMFVQLGGNPNVVDRSGTALRSDVPYQQCTTCSTLSTGQLDARDCSLADVSGDEATGRENCESAGDCSFTAGPGIRATYEEPCHTIDHGTSETLEYLMAGGDLDAMCYACVCTLDSVEDTKAELELHAAVTPGFLEDGQETYCAAMDAEVATASLWGNVATVIVVFVNQALKQGIKKSAQYLKSHTVEEEMISTSMRVYAVQVLNTAILMLILRSEIGFFGKLPGAHYSTVNAKWYAEVGAPLIMTMVIQFATPPSVHIVMGAVFNIKARVQSRSAKTQNQLNIANAPHGFEIAAGYGEVLLATSVTLIFGAGIPLLYHVAAVGFFVRYRVDKWVILRKLRKPPLYSKKLFETFDEMFAMLLVVHAAMAVYFFASAGGETPSTSFIYVDSVFLDGGLLANFHPHVWPVLAIFCAMLLAFTCKVVASCTCVKRMRRESTEDEDDEENLPPFTEAYQAGLIINEDDDYMLDEYEQLHDFSVAFQDALESAREKRQRPFKGKEGKKLYRRLKDVVSVVVDHEGGLAGNRDEDTFAANARP